MVDDVRIVESDLPPWATENTLQALVQAIIDLRGLTASEGTVVRQAVESINRSSSNPSGGTSGAIARLENIFSTRNAQNAQNSRSVDTTHNTMADAVNDFGQTSLKSKIYNSVLDAGQSYMFKFGRSIGMATKDMGSLSTAVMFFAGKLYDLTIGGVKASLDMYMELYKSGLLYNNMIGGVTHGLGTLGQAATMVGMPVLKLGELLKKYSETVSRYGVDSFAIIAKNTRSLGESLGLSASESTEALAEYLDNQRRQGTLHTMSMDQAEKNAAIQMRTTMNFAREMGVSTDLLKESQKKIADSTEFKAGLATIPAEIRAKMGGIASQILGMFESGGMGDVGKELMQVMAKGYLARGDKMMTDLASLGPKGALAAEQILQLGESFKRGNISQEEMIKRSQGIMATLGKMNSDASVGEFAARLTNAGNDVNYLVSAMAAASEMDANRKSGKQEHDDRIAAGMANMKTMTDRFTNLFSDFGARLFGNDKFIAAFEKVITKVSGSLEQIFNIIMAHSDDIVNFIGNMADAAVTFIDGIAKGESVFSDMKSWMEAIGVACGVMFIGIDNIGKGLKYIGKGFENIGPLFEKLQTGLSNVADFLDIKVMKTMGDFVYELTGYLSETPITEIFTDLFGTLALALVEFKGLHNAIIDFNTDDWLDSLGNIPVQIGNEFFKIGAVTADGIREKLYGLFLGDKYAGDVRDELDAKMKSIDDNKLAHLRVTEKEKSKEQVVTGSSTTSDATNNATHKGETSKQSSKDGNSKNNTTSNNAYHNNEVTTTDVYHSNEAGNKINKSILDATQYANALFEAMNNHLSAIEKNTKTITPAGNW